MCHNSQKSSYKEPVLLSTPTCSRAIVGFLPWMARTDLYWNWFLWFLACLSYWCFTVIFSWGPKLVLQCKLYRTQWSLYFIRNIGITTWYIVRMTDLVIMSPKKSSGWQIAFKADPTGVGLILTSDHIDTSLSVQCLWNLSKLWREMSLGYGYKLIKCAWHYLKACKVLNVVKFYLSQSVSMISPDSFQILCSEYHNDRLTLYM